MQLDRLDGEDCRECEATTRSDKQREDETARFALVVGAHEILLCRSHARMVPMPPTDKALAVMTEHPTLIQCGLTRNFLGQMVREAWVRWAIRQPEPKPHWLVPWADLGEADRDADREIGQAIALHTIAHFSASLVAHPERLAGEGQVIVERAEIEMALLETKVILPNLPPASQGRAFTFDMGKMFARWLTQEKPE